MGANVAAPRRRLFQGGDYLFFIGRDNFSYPHDNDELRLNWSGWNYFYLQIAAHLRRYKKKFACAVETNFYWFHCSFGYFVFWTPLVPTEVVAQL